MSEHSSGLSIGFIGLGIMGKSMARNLLRAGLPLIVYNRSKAKVDELAGEGARAGESPADVARNSDIVVLCLPDTPDVEEVLFGSNGVAEGLSKGAIVLDCSTISPSATIEFAKTLAHQGVTLVDSPVSGGPKGAMDGTLTCMVGGEDAAVQRCRPIFDAIGKTVVHLGASGAGQLTKSCNQMVIAGTMLAVSEAVALCRKYGIDPYKVREVLLGGSAQSFVLQNHAKRLLDNKLEPGFRSSLMLKDIKLAAAAGQQAGVFMPGTALSLQMLGALCNGGRADLDSAALGLLVQELSGVEL